MKRDVSIYLKDVLESIQSIEEYVADLDEQQFQSDKKTQDSVMRRLAIIGEAVRNVPVDFRNQHPDIPWRDIAGMRDVLIHEYFGVSLDRIWETVVEDLPRLKEQLQVLIE